MSTTRVNKILKDLKISLDELKLLVVETNIDVSRPTNKLTQDEVNQINLLFLSRNSSTKTNVGKINLDAFINNFDWKSYEKNLKPKDFSTTPKNSKKVKIELGPDIFEDGDKIMFIAEHNWYFNMETGGQYGFVKNKSLGDIHFKIEVVENGHPRNFNEGYNVVVAIENIQTQNQKRLSADKIGLIEKEKNISFLLFLIRNNILKKEVIPYKLIGSRYVNDDKISIVQILQKLKGNIDTNHFKEIENIIEDYQKGNIDHLDIVDIAGLHNLIDKYFNIKVLSSSIKFQLWKKKMYPIDFDEIKNSLINYVSTNLNMVKLISAFTQLNKNNKQTVLQGVLSQFTPSGSTENYQLLFDAAKSFDISLDLSELNKSVLFKFWLNDFVDDVDIEYLLSEILRNHKNRRINLNDIDETNKENQNIFKKLTKDQTKNLFSFLGYRFKDAPTKEIYNGFKVLMLHIEEKSLKADCSALVSSVLDGFYKLLFFVDDFSNEIDYNDAVLFSGLLTAEKQKLFFKKILSLKERGMIELSLSDLDRLLVTDYNTSKISEEIDGVKIDYSVSVIIDVLKKMSKNEAVTQEGVFQYVANIINDPKDIIQITGFFDECEGRTFLRESRVQNEDGEVYSVYEKEISEKHKPRFSIYCDGKKALNFDGSPSLSQNGGEEFYWCENKPCFESCREKHTSENWKSYSLQDCLRIFDIECSDDTYSQLIGVINKCNKFFKHLNCRECGEIMHPSGKDNYGIYRVSNFNCSNSDCNELGNNIYLNHCSNGYCLDIIDSRDTVKCKPDYVGANCGWYVCNHCFACCKTGNLLSRKNNIESRGGQYNCHTEGHLNKQEICCNKCGEVFNENEVMGELYKKQLKWLIDNKATHPNIGSYNQRADGKWWFKWEIGNLQFAQYRTHLKNLRASGFQIPDYSKETNVSQLISEPYDDKVGVSNYNCMCGNELYLGSDEDMDANRRRAITKYHFNQEV